MPISRIETNSIASSQTLTTPIIATTMGVGGATPAGSGSGITFPAAQSASTDVNTLDDYEEGTWTPVITTSGTAPTGVSYGYRSGWYTKVGNIVRAHGAFKLSALSSVGSGEITITGFPFAQITTGGWTEGVGSIKSAFFTTSTTISNGLVFYMVSGGTQVFFRTGNSDASVPASELTSSTGIDIVIVYQTT